MTTPTIHTNGTAAKDLLEGYLEAIDKLRVAIEAVQRAGPNARDYYPQGAAAFGKAVAEQFKRIERLQEVRKELTVLADSVADHA